MKLTKSYRPVCRVFGEGKSAVVVTLDPLRQEIRFRLKGTKTAAGLPVAWLYRHAHGLRTGGLNL